MLNMQTRQMIPSFKTLIEIYSPTSGTFLVSNTERDEVLLTFLFLL